MSSIYAYFLVALLTSCSATMLKSHKEAKIKTVKISVQKKAKGRWQVHYVLPEKVKGVVFHRQTNKFRSQEWKVLNQDLIIGNIELKESLYSKSGKMFSEFTVEFPPYYEHTPKDYEFFQPYSDGGVLFYTGHLYINPLIEERAKKSTLINLNGSINHKWRSEVEVSSYGFDTVVIQGKVNKEKIRWIDKYNKGTYVYFGSVKPEVHESMVAVLDSGTPEWIIKTMKDFLPKLFKLYWEKTGQKLSFRPVVYLNYKPTKMSGISNSGGTLPGLVQLTIEGTAWEKKDDRNLEQIIWFLAHEAAHFWNGQMFDNIDDDAAWLHEGGADAFAYRSLLELGIINKELLIKRYNNALNMCMLGLRGDSLNNSSKNRKFKNYYHCGSTIMLIVERALLNKSKNDDLFRFWKLLLEQSKKNSNQYGRNDFHKLLKNHFNQEELSSLIEKLELVTQINLEEFMKELALLAGITLNDNNENFSSSFIREMQMAMLSRIMKSDCNGKVDINGNNGKGFLVGGHKSCKTFRKGVYDVIGVEGVKFQKNYEALYKAQNSCRKNKSVTLDLDKRKKLSIDCLEQDVRIFNWLEL